MGKYHCYVCGRDYDSPSLGGYGICPRCDIGLPPLPQNVGITPEYLRTQGAMGGNKCPTCGQPIIQQALVSDMADTRQQASTKPSQSAIRSNAYRAEMEKVLR